MNATRKSLALIAASLMAAIGLSACTSGPAPSGGGATYRFEDTGTFNSATPSAPSIDGPKLASLGPAPKPGQDVKIGILIKSLTNQYWQQVEAGLTQAKTDFAVQTSPVTQPLSSAGMGLCGVDGVTAWDPGGPIRRIGPPLTPRAMAWRRCDPAPALGSPPERSRQSTRRVRRGRSRRPMDPSPD